MKQKKSLLKEKQSEKIKRLEKELAECKEDLRRKDLLIQSKDRDIEELKKTIEKQGIFELPKPIKGAMTDELLTFKVVK